MFSTIEDLTSLASDEGYRHHNRIELETSALKGRKCCKRPWVDTEVRWHDSKVQRLVFMQSLNIKSQRKTRVRSIYIHFASQGTCFLIGVTLESDDDLDNMSIITFLLITAASKLYFCVRALGVLLSSNQEDPAAAYVKIRPIPHDLSDGQTESQLRAGSKNVKGITNVPWKCSGHSCWLELYRCL